LPALIFPSPVIVDQAFPRTDDQLRYTALTLGALSAEASRNSLILGVPEIFIEVAKDFNWCDSRGSIRSEIYNLLNLLIFQPHRNVGRVTCRAVGAYQAHPIPTYCNVLGNVEFWAEEMGRLVARHQHCTDAGKRCAGVACILAFSGHKLGRYRSSKASRFSLVGPAELAQLSDAFEWQTAKNDHTIKVSYSDVCRNFRLIGAVSNDMNAQGHSVLRFSAGASWSFSQKWGNDIGDNALKELIPFTNLPLRIIKRALGRSLKPRMVLRACLGAIELAI
jgi:hypothetical protein